MIIKGGYIVIWSLSKGIGKLENEDIEKHCDLKRETERIKIE